MYIAIDLKSFYASVECMERGLDPLTTNLVVADASRTEKTICLAVSPSLKQYGIPGRARLFEVVQKIKEVNACRGTKDKEVSYIVAPPRMAKYMEVSTKIYSIYLRYIAPEDIHVYSIDEVFIDVDPYYSMYNMSPRELATKLVKEVYNETGITATVGIGTNLYLCKVAMDIMAKKMPPDADGMRIAELDEMSYKRELWNHRPITDFWRVGRGTAKKLESVGIYTMGDIARCSVKSDGGFYNEALLYRLFGVNAELLIDHAWGYEPCTIAAIKAYKPSNHSISSGQVLSRPYDHDETRLIVHEMVDLLVLDLVDKRLVTDQLILTIGYDVVNLTDPDISKKYNGPVTTDHYGRKIPKHAHGTANLERYSSSTKIITKAVLDLYDKIINPDLYARRITIAAGNVISEDEVNDTVFFEQMDLFTDYEALEAKRKKEEEELKKERNIQEAILGIHKKYGKNALLKGMNLEEGATAMERNAQIGGHKA